MGRGKEGEGQGIGEDGEKGVEGGLEGTQQIALYVSRLLQI
jgi:hypothetical protein